MRARAPKLADALGPCLAVTGSVDTGLLCTVKSPRLSHQKTLNLSSVVTSPQSLDSSISKMGQWKCLPRQEYL